MIWLSGVLFAVAITAAAPRWLRIAQREHYLAGSATRFMMRWWISRPINVALALAGAAGASVDWLGPVALLVAIVGPVGLSVRGRTSPLAWTPRLRRVVAVAAIFVLAALAVWPRSIWVLPLAGPLLVDLALIVLRPVEERLGRVWVESAAAALAGSGARVVGITGSYGKTTTKGYLRQLLGGVTTVVASPASFNNRMGLARAINENLLPGTDVFIAEMGTYGPGEIRDLCDWITPEVAVITAIGPVHLERMGTEENIAAAKREIVERARVAVLNIDHPLLAAIAEEESAVREVITCSGADPDAAVFANAESGEIVVGGTVVGGFDPSDALAGNVACAVAAAIALGFDPSQFLGDLVTLPAAPHRLTVSTSDRGFFVIDDTFNSNPAGARAALETLVGIVGEGRRVMVTPGMVELGRRQRPENRALAARADEAGVEVIAVGRTNRRSLRTGGAVIVFDTLAQAVAWVKANLGPGDAVLYENDLPDHYP